MKNILLFFLFLISYSHSSVLSDKMQDKMNYICYYASLLDGSNDGSLPQSAFTGTENGRTLIKTLTSSSIIPNPSTCNNWNLNPYVNLDTETMGIIANTSCTNYEVETGDEHTQEATYYTDIEQHRISVDCQSGCEIPKDSRGNNYDLNKRIYQSECNIDTLNRLYKENNLNSSYVVSDAQYLDCDASTPSATGCYYLMGFEGFPDTNETNLTKPNAMNLTPVTDEIKKTNQAIDSMKNELKNKLDENKQSLQGIDSRLANIKNAIDASARKIAAAEHNTTVKLHEIHTTLKEMKGYMRTDLNNTDINDSLLGIVEDMNVTFNLMNTMKDGILSVFNSHTSPIFTGTGQHVFTADIYDGTVVFDLSMIKQLRQYFDIVFLLILAWINFKIYRWMLEFLIKIGV